MSTEKKPSTTEVLESLTGHEEQAIVDAFAQDVLVLMARRPATYLRALAMVVRTRETKNAATARAEVLGMPLKDVNDLFDESADDEDDEDEDLPGAVPSESGKDDG